jgi:large subunit ribosomal protein L17
MGNLALSLLEVGYLRTTHARAKALQSFAERLMTLAKRGDLHARRQALSLLPHGKRPRTAAADRDWTPPNKRAISRLFDEMAPQYETRQLADGSEVPWNGGYTRVVKLTHRKGDAAEISLVSWVEPDAVVGAVQPVPVAEMVATAVEEAPVEEAAIEEVEAAPSEEVADEVVDATVEVGDVEAGDDDDNNEDKE